MRRTPSYEYELFTYTLALIEYNSQTGIFKWKYREGSDRATKIFNGSKYAGQNITNLHKGYISTAIKYKGKRNILQMHRFAWFSVYGEVPINYIDHINQIRTDNRITNLRVVTSQENSKNRSKACNNTSGYTGIFWCNNSKKWRATCKVDGKIRHIGLFTDIEVASEKVREFRLQNGYSENHGS